MNRLIAATAHAGTPAVPTAEALVRTVLSLLFVLALVLVLGWLARRFSLVRANRGRRLQMLEGLRVGTRERVIIIRSDGRDLLLGVTPSRIDLLAELGNSDQSDFADTLASTIGGPDR